MIVFYEETIKRKCEVNIDLHELAEYESIEEYIEKKRKNFSKADYFDVYESETSKPTNIETGDLNRWDKSYLSEIRETEGAI